MTVKQRLTEWGFKPADWIKYGGMLLFAIKFFYADHMAIQQNGADVTAIKTILADQTKMNQSFQLYIQNHDAWTSSVIGTRFLLGIPANQNWEPGSWRSKKAEGILIEPRNS